MSNLEEMKNLFHQLEETEELIKDVDKFAHILMSNSKSAVNIDLQLKTPANNEVEQLYDMKMLFGYRHPPEISKMVTLAFNTPVNTMLLILNVVITELKKHRQETVEKLQTLNFKSL